MLFLVVSQPGPTRPSEMQPFRKDYWPWVERNREAGLVKHVWARTGRGAVVVFDVDSNETLHRLLNEWCEIVPASFDIHPLLDSAQATAFLNKT